MVLNFAFHLLASMRMLNVLNSPIQDCDEVYNYLEPLNFITRGFGKETWEYSPIYAIRSYAYLLPLSIVLKPFTILSDYFQLFPSWRLFYLIRSLIVSFTVYSEYQLYKSLKSTFNNKNYANWYLLFTLVSTGYSHASVSLLPSNLAMNCTTLSLAYLINFTKSKKTRHSLLSIKWLIIGTLWGWPFIAALGIPLIIYILSTASKIMLNRFILWSFVAFFFNLVVIMQIDYSFYHKTMVVPLNIVLYNVINTNELRGPDIFGTEPIEYYIFNLLLNFNLISIFAYFGLILIPILSNFKKINDTGLNFKGLIIILSGLALWSVVFFNQPHKEERFLYPVYSFINVSAAITVQFLLNTLAIILNLIFNSKLIKLIQKALIYSLILMISIISIFKTISLSQNYTGYIELYKYLPTDTTSEVNICTSREWYHYPSSFFLPSNYRLKFTKSTFNGLLPGDFLESESIFNGVRAIPEGMNDLNQFDASKLSSIEDCNYFIDINEKINEEIGEINFWESDNWELINQINVINSNKSFGLSKLIWLPSFIKNIKHKLIGEIEYEKVGLFKQSTNTSL